MSDVNYRVRCETDTMIDGLPCRIIRYGMTKAECNAPLYCPAWYDVGTGYAELSVGGRRTPRENEMPGRHYFNKRIMTDEEKNRDLRAQTLQAHSDSRSVAAPDGEGSADGVEELQANVTEGIDGCDPLRAEQEMTT